MKKMMIALSTTLSILLLSGCGGEATTDGVVDTKIQPHKFNRVVDATTIGDMTMSVTNDENSYNFLFSLTDSSKHSQIYIDTDKKRDTGFTPWLEGGVGAEYLMEDGNLFRYKGSGGDDFDNNWELVSWGEDYITSRDIAFETLGNIDTFNVQGVLLDSNWWWDSSSDVQEFVKEATGNNTGEQVTRQELIEMIKNSEDYSQVDVSGITDMSLLFYNKEVQYDITGWDVSNVTEMYGVFYGATTFNQDISSWDVSNVQSMADMFTYAEAFNQPIGSWDVSNVTYMSDMFQYAKAFNQPIGDWDVSNVTNMGYMLDGAISFNQDISEWDVSNVTYMVGMFRSAISFNQPIGDWNVSNVTRMVEMFMSAGSFNQPLNNWNVSSVADMGSMFHFAVDFNQPIGDWDVSNVTSVRMMFDNATDFNQDIKKWDISSVTRNISFSYNSALIDEYNPFK